jgi:hypothetical protein
VLRVAGAHASFLEQGPVVLGRDTRPSGAWVARAAQAALLASGRDVIEVGVAPTPTILYAIRHHAAAGGLAVTASHNPALGRLLFGQADLPRPRSRGVARRAEARPGWVTHERRRRREDGDASAAIAKRSSPCRKSIERGSPRAASSRWTRRTAQARRHA